MHEKNPAMNFYADYTGSNLPSLLLYWKRKVKNQNLYVTAYNENGINFHE